MNLTDSWQYGQPGRTTTDNVVFFGKAHNCSGKK